MVFVADVLGHGAEAAEVARLLKGLVLQGIELPPDVLVEWLHRSLRYTRGACLLALRVGAGGRQLHWAGAGNVRARLWHAGAPKGIPLLIPSGIVGYNLRRIQASTAEVTPPACLAVATDGLADEALEQEPYDAGGLLQRFARPHDDATVLVVRWD
ncbi:MAG: SpoIIE family protein phosphatase [Bacillota bacterium]